MTPAVHGQGLFLSVLISSFIVGGTEERRRLQVRFLACVFSATNPQHARQIDSSGSERNRIERIRNVNERTGFLPLGRLRQKCKGQACSAGRRRAAQFDKRSSRETAAQNSVELRNPARLEFDRGTAV